MKLLHRTVVTPVILAGTALALAGLLTACSTTSAPTPPMASATSTSHNAQDTAFAQAMIVHHQGAIEMADLAATRASSPQVKDLAGQIKAAQQPEIDAMTSWLMAWGEPVDMPGMGSTPSPSGSMPGMDMSTPMPTSSSASGMEMPGMTAQEMASLKATTGTAFDKLFLTLMTQHHQGAVSMAKAELSQGKNADARKLAQSIVTSQTKQIADMQTLLSTL
ncbi:MAG: DUF305 domain-containing protein [Microbacteriaceae bacterium]